MERSAIRERRAARSTVRYLRFSATVKSKLLNEAIGKIKNWPADAQDQFADMALDIMPRLRMLSMSPPMRTLPVSIAACAMPNKDVPQPTRRSRRRSPNSAADEGSGRYSNGGVLDCFVAFAPRNRRGLSCSRLSRASTSKSHRKRKDVDGWNKSGHDDAPLTPSANHHRSAAPSPGSTYPSDLPVVAAIPPPARPSSTRWRGFPNRRIEVYANQLNHIEVLIRAAGEAERCDQPISHLSLQDESSPCETRHAACRIVDGYGFCPRARRASADKSLKPSHRRSPTAAVGLVSRVNTAPHAARMAGIDVRRIKLAQTRIVGRSQHARMIADVMPVPMDPAVMVGVRARYGGLCRRWRLRRWRRNDLRIFGTRRHERR